MPIVNYFIRSLGIRDLIEIDPKHWRVVEKKLDCRPGRPELVMPEHAATMGDYHLTEGLRGGGRLEAHIIYRLAVIGSDKPESLNVFYVGVTNNPLARLHEHFYKSHSLSMRLMMELIGLRRWAVQMDLLCWSGDRHAAESLEQQMIRANLNEFMLNHECLEIPLLKKVQELWPDSSEIVTELKIASND